MATSQELELIITARDQATGDLRKAASNVDALGKAADRSAGRVGMLGQAMSFALGGALLNGISAVGQGLTDFIGGGFEDARGAALLFGQTESVIESTGGAAGVTADQVTDLATALSDASGASLFGDDQIQGLENLLLTFTNIKGPVLEAATRIGADMAQALGTEPQAQATALGKALQDPVKGMAALARVGVTFTEQQKEQITAMQEAGNMAGAQQIILDELATEFGGSAQAAADAAGPWNQIKAVMGETGESIATGLLPAIDKIGTALLNPAVQEGITVLTEGLTTGINTAVTWLTDTGIPALTTAWASISTAFSEGGFAGLFELILPYLQTFGSSIVTWISEQAVVLAGSFASWASAIIEWIPGAISAYMEAWPGMLNTFLTWIGEQAGPILSALGAWAISMIGWIAPMLPGFLTALGSIALTIITFILETAVVVGTHLLQWALAFVTWIATEAIPKLIAELPSIAEALYGFVVDTSIALNEKLVEWGTAFLAWVGTSVLPFLSAKLGEIATAITGWIGTTATTLLTEAQALGSALIDGIIAGLGDIATLVKDKVVGGVQGGIAGVKAFFGIKSPSKYMAEEVGAPLAEGITAGFIDGSTDLADLFSLGAWQPIIDEQRQVWETIGMVIHDEMDKARQHLAAVTAIMRGMINSVINGLGDLNDAIPSGPSSPGPGPGPRPLPPSPFAPITPMSLTMQRPTRAGPQVNIENINLGAGSGRDQARSFIDEMRAQGVDL